MAERPLQVGVATFDRSGRLSVTGRLDLFAEPSANGRYLRIPAGWSRREVDIVRQNARARIIKTTVVLGKLRFLVVLLHVDRLITSSRVDFRPPDLVHALMIAWAEIYSRAKSNVIITHGFKLVNQRLRVKMRTGTF
jgi:hypothetical protein